MERGSWGNLGLAVARREVWSAMVRDRRESVTSPFVAFVGRIRGAAPRDRGDPDREELLSRALYLSLASVCAGALIGGFSVAIGIVEDSVGVLGSGLGLLADLAGSVVLVWRFNAERRHPVHAERAERRAGAAIVVALGLVSAVVAVEAIRALADHEAPAGSWLSLVAAGIALVALPPLAVAKRRTAVRLGSHALKGDSSITAIGAATGLIALIGLALLHAFGWWWADRAAALIVAAIAASEGFEVLRGLRSGEALD
jgi:divalent metal cation (Fe/Co/Zn/Cd) transporter